MPFKYTAFLILIKIQEWFLEEKDHVISFVLEDSLEIDIVKFKFDHILLTVSVGPPSNSKKKTRYSW